MRILLLLRGAPGCGKSTWVEENDLKPYTLSTDEIRLMYQSPVMDAEGMECVSQENDNAVWKTFFRILRSRMQRGDFTVVDATNSRASELNRYKELCGEFRYRAYCVDFTDIPVEEVKRRNAQREPFKRVPERVIDTMYARFSTQKVPSGIKEIRPEELDTVWLKIQDFSHYRKVHHIGDIHGCGTPLQKYFSDNGGLKDDEMYIFTGDYVDRGIENAEVVKFLISIMEKKNVLLLEGNHEKWLWQWANGEICQDNTGKTATEFELFTAPELEEAGISKKEVRNLYRRFGQCAYYLYDGKTYLVTHGGLSTLPGNLSLVATDQMIKGAGSFNDAEKAAAAFSRNTPDNCFQIHGHRNPKGVALTGKERVFNLEGGVEYGGFLRCLQIDHDGVHPAEVKNDIYKNPEIEKEHQALAENPIADVLVAFRHNKYIVEKKFGNISSFNYTDEAFQDRIWNSRTVKARGLYLDTAKGKVAARAYDKFFNIGESEKTSLGSLRQRFRFPVEAYVKENGFLGIVSWNEYDGDLLVACKSTTNSRFALWFKEMLHCQMSQEKLEEMKAFIREKDVSLVFECVDMEHDPHVIEYSKSRLVLLDIVRNGIKFEKYRYQEMCSVAERFGLEHKERAYVFETWQEFFDWHDTVQAEDYRYRGRRIEGFVIEDENGYMTKVKTAYYHFWKQMRSVACEVKKKGSISNTASLATPLANEFYGWLRERYAAGELKNMPQDICGLRRLFLEVKRK